MFRRAIAAITRDKVAIDQALPATVFAFRFGTLASCAAFAFLAMTSDEWSLGYLVPHGVALGIGLERPTGRRAPPSVDSKLVPQ